MWHSLLGIDRWIDVTDLDWSMSTRWPAWLVVAMLATAVAAGVWGYRRQPLAHRTTRYALAWLRGLALALVVTMLIQPAIALQVEGRLQRLVIVLVDRSASMAVNDMDEGGGASRGQRIVSALADWPLLGGDRPSHRLTVYSFADRARPVADRSPSLAEGLGVADDLPQRVIDELAQSPPTGSSRLGEALIDVIERTGDRPLAGVVVISDGRVTGGPALAAVGRSAAQRGVPVYPVLVGQPTVRDAAIRRIVHEPLVLAGRPLDATGVIDTTGVADAPAVLEWRVDGVLISRQSITLGDGPQVHRIRIGPGQVPAIDNGYADGADGERDNGDNGDNGDDGNGGNGGGGPGARASRNVRLTVAISAADGEATAANNAASAQVTIVNRPVRVVYLEGRPRFAWHSLRRVLDNGPAFATDAVLLDDGPAATEPSPEAVGATDAANPADAANAAGAGNAAEPTDPGTAISAGGVAGRAAAAASLARLQRGDVVIIGDLPVGRLGEQATAALAQAVRRGAATVWYGLSAESLESFADTPLAELLPLRSAEPAATRRGVADDATIVEPTAAYAMVGLSQHDAAEAWAAVAAGSPPVTLGPGAWPLVVVEREDRPLSPWPLLAINRWATSTNASQDTQGSPATDDLRSDGPPSVAIATDSLWRWQRGAADEHERFWHQLIGMLAAGTDGRPTPIRQRQVELADVRADPAALSQLAWASGGQVLTLDQLDVLARSIDEAPALTRQRLTLTPWDHPAAFALLLGLLLGEWFVRHRSDLP